jgi:hypothetical protein
MTDEEKVQQRKNLLYESEQADITLSHLTEKATSVADALKDVVGILDHYSNHAFDPERPDIFRRAGVVIDLSNSKYKDAMNFEAAKTLLNELWEAKQKAYQLSQRKDATSRP